MKKNMPHKEMYEKCKQHMHSYVLIETKDGLRTDGIITGLDEDNVYIAVPMTGQTEASQMNPNYTTEQVYRNPHQGYGPPYRGGRYGSYDRYGRFDRYGHGYGYGYGYGPQQRFRRLVLPLAFLATVSLLPWY